jgi:hypothetical protein
LRAEEMEKYTITHKSALNGRLFEASLMRGQVSCSVCERAAKAKVKMKQIEGTRGQDCWYLTAQSLSLSMSAKVRSET